MPAYSPYASPQVGFGAYGGVPGSIGLPSPASDLAAQYPNLSQTNAQLSQNVLNESRGMLNPETVNNIQDTAAAWGVGSGMPGFGGGAGGGSGLGLNLGLRSLGLTSQALQQQGLGDYLNLAGGISKTQTLDPALQASIASRNAQFAAAPNPAMATSQLKQDYLTGLNQFTPRGAIPAHITNPPNLTPPGGTGPNPNGGPLSGYSTNVYGPLPPFNAPNFPDIPYPSPVTNQPQAYVNMPYAEDQSGPNNPNSPLYDPYTPFGTNPEDFTSAPYSGYNDQYGALGAGGGYDLSDLDQLQ